MAQGPGMNWVPGALYPTHPHSAAYGWATPEFMGGPPAGSSRLSPGFQGFQSGVGCGEVMVDESFDQNTREAAP
jgi:hypothetical protein